MNPFDHLYQELIRRILDTGIRMFNERTQHWVRAIPGTHLSIDLLKEGFPLLTLRKIPVRLFVAEQLWFLSGSQKPAEFLQRHATIWDPFMEETGIVTAAYGHRWRHHFGRDQIAELINLLRRDPSSRQGVVLMWDASKDGLEGPVQKNVPCPCLFVANILEGRLNMHVMMRANDVIIGLPYDVAGFALLQCLLAQKLSLSPGIYSHTIAYAEIYEIHTPAARELVRRSPQHPRIRVSLPPEAFERAEQKDHALVTDLVKLFQEQYQPQAAIDGLKPVL